MESSFGTSSLQWLQVGSQKQTTINFASTLYKGIGFSNESTICKLAADCPIRFAIMLYALSLMNLRYLSVKNSASPVLINFSNKCTNTASSPIYSGLTYFCTKCTSKNLNSSLLVREYSNIQSTSLLIESASCGTRSLKYLSNFGSKIGVL